MSDSSCFDFENTVSHNPLGHAPFATDGCNLFRGQDFTVATTEGEGARASADHLDPHRNQAQIHAWRPGVGSGIFAKRHTRACLNVGRPRQGHGGACQSRQ